MFGQFCASQIDQKEHIFCISCNQSQVYESLKNSGYPKWALKEALHLRPLRP